MSNITVKDLQANVNALFVHIFGPTPLRQRLADIRDEALELSRYTDIRHLEEELGDLLASAIQLCNECEWSVEDLLDKNRKKILHREKQYKSLGRKTTVAILGGAFDPVTLGHIDLCKFVLDTSGEFDEVWLMPCARHMFGKKMADASHRYEMCKLASQVDGRIKVSKFEIDNDLHGETYQLVKRLLAEGYSKAQYNFSIIIGMDNAMHFHRWVNYEDLERMIRFVVVPREGVEVDPTVNWFMSAPHLYLVPDRGHTQGSSSTIVRERVQGGLPVDHLVHPEVLKYIQENDLYGYLQSEQEKIDF